MGVLKLTIQQFFRVNGSSTQRKGVTPDISFPDTFKHLKTGERNLDNSIPWRKVDKLVYSPWPKVTWTKEELAARSQARQAKSPYFISLEKRSLLLKQRQDETQIPLQRKAYEERMETQRKEMDALVPKPDKLKALFTVKPLPYRPAKPPAVRNGSGHSAEEDARAERDKEKAWTENLSKDATVGESLLILVDMMAS